MNIYDKKNHMAVEAVLERSPISFQEQKEQRTSERPTEQSVWATYMATQMFDIIRGITYDKARTLPEDYPVVGKNGITYTIQEVLEGKCAVPEHMSVWDFVRPAGEVFASLLRSGAVSRVKVEDLEQKHNMQ